MGYDLKSPPPSHLKIKARDRPWLIKKNKKAFRISGIFFFIENVPEPSPAQK